MLALPFTVAVCGLHELPGHAAGGMTHVLSILDPDFPVPDAFGGYGAHARLELRFDDITEDRPGWSPPRAEHVAQLLAFGRDMQAEPAPARLLVHCHAGVSRSTASLLLMLAQALPDAPGPALAETILGIRAQAWPNLRLMELGDAQLGRGGALVQAAAAVYRAQLRRRPDYAAEMTADGRGREVALARERV